jgi:hypothetical protein
MDHEDRITARLVPRIGDIDPVQWDACANPCERSVNPFVSHGFLDALERSKSVGPPETGWIPHHVVLDDADGIVAAAMPCYLKLHSAGEYVFDHAWAQAYERAGGRYYPKLQAAVPFSPVPGPRLLVRPGPDADVWLARLADAGAAAAVQNELSSLHITFLPETEWTRLGARGFLQRTDQQFHWFNPGYRTFDEFLATLTSRKRKAIRKERSDAAATGLSIRRRRGAEITEAHWDAFFAFYQDTGARKWGRPYLNRAFFSLLGSALGERCLLISAERNGRPVAGALNLIGGDCLFGRYWGAVEHHPCLHFELCYYQAIDYAIEHGLPRVEAGAQDERRHAEARA